jgi:hypothetical protein
MGRENMRNSIEILRGSTIMMNRDRKRCPTRAMNDNLKKPQKGLGGLAELKSQWRDVPTDEEGIRKSISRIGRPEMAR